MVLRIFFLLFRGMLISLFTREYTQCTAGYTFCFVVVVVGATFNQTWHYFSRQLIKHE
jgi:hypothetical protein